MAEWSKALVLGCFQTPVRNGVGSNPTLVIISFVAVSSDGRAEAIDSTVIVPVYGPSSSSTLIMFDTNDDEGNTLLIRNQFAPRRSFEERGILDLKTRTDNVDQPCFDEGEIRM
jgi:hypothetical protein